MAFASLPGNGEPVQRDASRALPAPTSPQSRPLEFPVQQPDQIAAANMSKQQGADVNQPLLDDDMKAAALLEMVPNEIQEHVFLKADDTDRYSTTTSFTFA